MALLLLWSYGASLDSRGARARASVSLCAWTDSALKAQELRIAAATWKLDVQAATGVVHPSRAYAGVWLRDSFWTLTALSDAVISSRALARFAAAQRPSGQLPTQFKTWILHPLYFSDESTLLFLIWSDWALRHGGAIPKPRVLAKALAYVRAHVVRGRYQSPSGTYASWFDSYRFARAGTLGYNQGLLVVALRAGSDLHLSVTAGELRAAETGYRTLATARGQYLPLSDHLAYHDISSLAGEFLSEWLFDRPILSDAVVRRTLAAQPRFGSGFRVVADARGQYLSPAGFIAHAPAGEYQNGASWLLFDYLALAAGYMHHVPGAGTRLHDRLVEEFASKETFHEYLDTNPGRSMFGTEPTFRDEFAWDTFVVAADRLVRRDCHT